MILINKKEGELAQGSYVLHGNLAEANYLMTWLKCVVGGGVGHGESNYYLG